MVFGGKGSARAPAGLNGGVAPARCPIGPRASMEVVVVEGERFRCGGAQRKGRGACTATRDAPEEQAKVLEAWRWPRV